jgi:hypothetical protein
MVRFVLISVLSFAVLTTGFDYRVFACNTVCDDISRTAAVSRFYHGKERNKFASGRQNDEISVTSIRFLSNVAKLKNEIQGTWNLQKIETTDQSLNSIIQNGDFSNIFIEFTKSGFVLFQGKETGTKYRIENNKIILSEGLAKNMTHPEAKANIKSNELTVNLTAALVKQILLTVKDRYVESGGEIFVAKMIENIANTHSIEAIITFKRK